MGRRIAYLPAYYIDKKIVPAGAAFILAKEGEIRTLRGDENSPMTIDITAIAPTIPDADTQIDRPMIVVKPDETYELFVWNDGWSSLSDQIAGNDLVSIGGVPAGGLYWMVKKGSRKLERIFTIDAGRQVWW